LRAKPDLSKSREISLIIPVDGGQSGAAVEGRQ